MVPVLYFYICGASRALTKAQQNYAQIEKETLAITFGCTNFHQYVYGREVIVESDHSPLQSIFKKPLFKAPLRLQKLLLDLQKYDLKVIFKPGRSLKLADTLSRAYLNEIKEDLCASDITRTEHVLYYTSNHTYMMHEDIYNVSIRWYTNQIQYL